MSDELKPVRCGCGGDVEIIKHPNGKYTVSCTRGGCMASVGWCPDEKTAIEAWNRAMGAKDINVPAKKSDLIRREDVLALLDSIYTEIENHFPSEESERKKGEWIKVEHWGRSYKCNQCGNYLDFDGVNAGRGDANFCPNCGADMRGKE